MPGGHERPRDALHGAGPRPSGGNGDGEPRVREDGGPRGRLDLHGRRGEEISLENKNLLIGRYRGAIGVKTGFTESAGKCLVALAERGGKRVLLVLLNAPDRWRKAEEILDAAFARGSGAFSARP